MAQWQACLLVGHDGVVIHPTLSHLKESNGKGTACLLKSIDPKHGKTGQFCKRLKSVGGQILTHSPVN